MARVKNFLPFMQCGNDVLQRKIEEGEDVSMETVEEGAEHIKMVRHKNNNDPLTVMVEQR